jgi:hypothetical protein
MTFDFRTDFTQENARLGSGTVTQYEWLRNKNRQNTVMKSEYYFNKIFNEINFSNVSYCGLIFGP